MSKGKECRRSLRWWSLFSHPLKITTSHKSQVLSLPSWHKGTHRSLGLPELACRLLQFEPSIADRLPSLLLMEQYEIALEEAMRSGDEDLSLFTALHIYLKWEWDQCVTIRYHTEGMKRTEFIELVKKYPGPMNSLREYLRIQNHQEYEDLLKSQGK